MKLRFVLACLVACILTVEVRAADTTYESLVKTKARKKESPRAMEGGAEHALFRLWYPSETQNVRGLIFNPFYTKAVTQEHWQAACREWDFGILAANLFGVEQGEFANIVNAALSDFTQQSGHEELSSARFCLVGMSAGAGMSTRIAEQIPERVIAVGAVCLEVGPSSEPSYKIPMMTIFGERDGRQGEKLLRKLPQVRNEGARFGIAVQWRRRHEFARANNMLLPYFDNAIKARLVMPGEPLRSVDESAGWLGSIANWESGLPDLAPFPNYKYDKSMSCWFINEATARSWQAFVSRSPLVKLLSPNGLGDGKPFKLFRVGEEIPVRFRLTETESTNVKVSLFAGKKRVADDIDNSSTISFDEPGIYPLYLQWHADDGSIHLSQLNTIVVANL